MIMITITFLFLFSRLSLFTMIDLDSLKPFFVDDKVKLIYSSTIVSVLHVSPLFLTLIIPKNNVINNKKIFRYLLFSYLFSFLIIALILITIIGVFGIDLASLYTYPSYVVLKNLNILILVKNYLIPIYQVL